MEWISVKDRLPETDTVNLWFSDGSVSVDILRNRSNSDGGGFDCVFNYLHNYTHWMPLPPPPKD